MQRNVWNSVVFVFLGFSSLVAPAFSQSGARNRAADDEWETVNVWSADGFDATGKQIGSSGWLESEAQAKAEKAKMEAMVLNPATGEKYYDHVDLVPGTSSRRKNRGPQNERTEPEKKELMRKIIHLEKADLPSINISKSDSPAFFVGKTGRGTAGGADLKFKFNTNGTFQALDPASSDFVIATGKWSQASDRIVINTPNFSYVGRLNAADKSMAGTRTPQQATDPTEQWSISFDESGKKEDILNGTTWVDKYAVNDSYWVFSNGKIDWYFQGRRNPSSQHAYRIVGDKLYSHYITDDPTYSREHESTIDGDVIHGFMSLRRKK